MYKLKPRFTLTIAGPSNSGKSELTCSLIDNAQHTLEVPPTKIYICYGCSEAVYTRFETLPYPIEYINGVPPEDFKFTDNSIVIFDDLQSRVNEIEPYFTKYAHHKKISCIYITQNLFLKSNRTVTLNSLYIIMMKNTRDASQISTLAAQISPQNSKWLVKTYHDVTGNKPHSYLMFDFHQLTPDKFMIRDNIIAHMSDTHVDDSQYEEYDISAYAV